MDFRTHSVKDIIKFIIDRAREESNNVLRGVKAKAAK